ncbi:GDYXXLXY domain-containing protein [Spongiimicrobium sp. 3-5]|uniref:GDYXXLXY domain-containing protein n=1 Tax=Spongiimicrobium sp. 3-5 TaxID=3332596 RepID=UPI00397F30EE
MKKYRRIVILGNLIILLVLFNNSIFQKEALLSDGQLVLLELAPVDPRSLMQGDYMRLRYKISEGVAYDSISKRGFCIVKLDSRGVAERVRIQKENLPLNRNEHPIEYTSDKWSINIGAESYFFQEGDADKFENAVFGGVKIDADGNSILIGLYNKDLQQIH